MKKNIDIRLMIDDAGLMHKEIAAKIGLNPCSFSRLLRHELTAANRQRIIQAIQKLKGHENG